MASVSDTEFEDVNDSISISCTVILVIAAVIGTFGNILILYVIATNKTMKHDVDNILIVNLTISDLYVTMVADPMSIVAKLKGEQFFDTVPGLCQTIASICTISCVTSMMTIAVMSINRYFYICKHDVYTVVFTKKKSICICISLYGIGTFLVLLNTMGVGDHGFDRKSLECIWDRMATYPFTVAFSVCLVWIPCIITGICFLRIYLYVRAHRRKIIQQQVMKNTKHLTNRSYRLAKTLFIIYTVFLTCWAPYALLIAVDSKDELPHELHVYITVFAHLHPSVNWLIYYLTNKNFAEAYKQILSNLAVCNPGRDIAFNSSTNHDRDAVVELRGSGTPDISRDVQQPTQVTKYSPDISHCCHPHESVLPTVPGSFLSTLKSESSI